MTVNKITKFIIFISLIPILFFKFLLLGQMINLIFFILILSIFVGVIFFRNKNSNDIEDELDYINNNIKSGNENLEEIFSSTEKIKILWESYKEKMFQGKSKVAPEEYFNEVTLFEDRINFSLLNYIPNLFITIGIMGTFLGLSLGLRDLIVVDIFSTSNEIFSNTIKNLLRNVSTSFYTSLYGMYYSILFYIENNNYINKLEGKIDLINLELRKKYLYDSETEKIEDIKNEISKQSNTVLMVEEKISNMAISFENELKKTLKKVFNENYVTEMNRVQNNFINNSQKLMDNFLVKNEELLGQFETLKQENRKSMNLISKINYTTEKIELFSDSIFNTSTIIDRINSNLSELTNKYYSKEQLEKIILTLNTTLEVNKENFIELSKNYEIFKNEMAISLESFYKNFRNLDYSDLRKIIEDTKKISNYNKEMTEKYYGLYESLKYKSGEIKNNYKELYSEIEKLYSEDKLKQSIMVDELLKNKNTLQDINNNIEREINSYRDYMNKLQILLSDENKKEILLELNDLTEKLDKTYLRIENAKKYVKKQRNRKNKLFLFDKNFRKKRELNKGNRNE